MEVMEVSRKIMDYLDAFKGSKPVVHNSEAMIIRGKSATKLKPEEIVPKLEELFKELNIEKIGALIGENQFDMYKYAEFYCQQDVRILRESFNVFRKGFLEDFKIDVIHFISISSLANEVFNQNVYYPNKHLYKVGGHLRHFLSKSVYGG